MEQIQKNNKRAILLVDDNTVLCEMLKENFELEGYYVETAADGFEALKCVNRKFFDVILMDFKMPEMNGIETSRKMFNMGLKSPIIMMTAYDEDLKKEIDNDHLFAILHKPFKIQTLMKRMESL